MHEEKIFGKVSCGYETLCNDITALLRQQGYFTGLHTRIYTGCISKFKSRHCCSKTFRQTTTHHEYPASRNGSQHFL
jgi:hypothetical protein